MPTIATGLVDTETVLADERVVDMSEEIAMLQPDESQFTTMLMRLGSRQAVREKINWLEDELFPNLSGLAATAASAVTGTTGTVVVTTGQGSFFRAKDIVRNALTGEAMKVESISTDTLTVTRGIGGNSSPSSASGADLVIIGNAAAQGATLGTRHITKKTLGYNYTQIQRDPWGFTGTEAQIETYGGPAPAHEEVKKLIEHKRAIEHTLFFGPRSFTSAAPNSVGTSGGAIEFITTNVFNASGSLTHANFDIYLQDAFAYGSKNKVIFAAPTAARAISSFLKAAWASGATPVDARPRKFGAVVDGYVSGTYGWEVPIVVKREWEQYSTVSPQYGGIMFVIDMDYVTFRPLRNRNTQLLRNRQANDADEETHEYRTEFSLEFRSERVHSRIYGITGP